MFTLALAHALLATVQFHALGDQHPLVSVLVGYSAPEVNPRFVDLHRILSERGELAARFTPEGPEGKIEWPLFYMLSDHFNDEGHEDWPHFTARLLRARAIGPSVEIWRVDA